MQETETKDVATPPPVETVAQEPLLTTLVRVSIESLLNSFKGAPQEVMNTILLQVSKGLVESCSGLRHACSLVIWDSGDYHLSVAKSKKVVEPDIELIPEIISKLNEASAAVAKSHASELEKLKQTAETTTSS